MIKKNWKTIVITIIIIIISMSVGAYAAYLINATEVSYLKSDGNTISVKAALDDLRSKVTDESTTTYKQGQIVSYNGEEFYVLYEGNDFIELLAKTNIASPNANKQEDLTFDRTAYKFSSTNYWGNATGLNFNLELPIGSSYAITFARKFAKNRSAQTGRLLTYQEVINLAGGTDWNSLTDLTIKNMLNGAGNSQGYEIYWLGSNSESDTDIVWAVNGRDSQLQGYIYNTSNCAGIRPVITVYTSSVRPVT